MPTDTLFLNLKRHLHDNIFNFSPKCDKKSSIIPLVNRLDFEETRVGYFLSCQNLEQEFEIESNPKSQKVSSFDRKDL